MCDFWWTKCYWGRFSPSTSISTPNFVFHRFLNSYHLSSGAGTIGQTVAAVPSGLSLIPWEKKGLQFSGISKSLQIFGRTSWAWGRLVVRYVPTKANIKKIHICFNAPNEIRTHDSSGRNVEGSIRRRTRGHSDRAFRRIPLQIIVLSKQAHLILSNYITTGFRTLFLNPRAAARYRALASVIPVPRLVEKRMYPAAVWQMLRTTYLEYFEISAVYRVNWATLRAHCDTKKRTPWFQSANELYRPSDCRLSAKLVSTLADRGCRVVSATNNHGR
jgi:hypothetical protein